MGVDLVEQTNVGGYMIRDEKEIRNRTVIERAYEYGIENRRYKK